MEQLAKVPEPQQQPPAYAFHDDSANQQAPSLRDFLAILKRRKAIAFQTFIVVVALGIVVTLMTKPIYRSVSRVLVEGKSAVMEISNNSNPLSSLFSPSSGHATQTQVEILRSSAIATKASKKSGVPLGRAFLDVRQIADTDVIELSVTSNSRDYAYRYLQAVPAVYLTDVRADRMRQVSSALEFAQKRLKEENTSLNQSELALQKFKESRKILDPQAESQNSLQTATTAKNALGDAQAQVDSLSAQLEAFKATRAALPTTIVNPTTTTNTTELQGLRQRIDELKSQRKQALFLYKPTDDQVRQIDRQIADLAARLRQTPRDVTTESQVSNPAIAQYDGKIADTGASLRAAQANVEILRTRADDLAKGLNRFASIEREQGKLQREIASTTGTVTSLAQSVEELGLRKKALESANDPINVIEAASQAEKISPKVSRNLILACVLGLLLACAAAMLQESFDDHLRDEDEVRQLLQVPVLGHFPVMQKDHVSLPTMLRNAQKRALEGEHSLDVNGLPVMEMEDGNERSESGYAVGSDRNLLEKFRVLRSNVQFTLINRSHATLLVTSSVPQEGKTYTTSNLAAAMALDGRRVILIDADLHRPRQHVTFDLPVQPGLTNILVGQNQLAECLHETGIAGLRLLPAGVLPPNPVELLNSPAMATLLETLQGEADLLIFDSPPLLATADAQVLASKVDGVLYVMQLGRVPKSAIVHSFEMMAQARANILGIVLNKIDSQTSHSGSYQGYNYSGYYGERDTDERSNGKSEATK